jgi:hypothetical protein
LLDETFGALSQHVQTAIGVLVKLMTSTEVDENGKPLVDARVQLAAATFIVEHVLGKPKAVVEVEADSITRQALAAAIVLDDGKAQDGPVVLDGEIVDEEEDDEDDDE